MIYFRSIERRDARAGEGYPFSTPLLRRLSSLSFSSPVTLLCGDNGCGKTTLIELIAFKARAERIGPPGGGLTPGQARIRQAADAFRAARSSKPSRCFLFTAEGFSKYVDYVVAEKQSAKEELDALPGLYGSDYARTLAAQPYAGTLGALDALYAAPLEEQSHGQGFLDFFQSRLLPGGLYLMDEPEAALSYINQLALIYIIKDAVQAGSQFLIATHSPILAAIPGAALLEMEEGVLKQRAYDELSQVQFLKRFLRDHARILEEE
jgi:predicted ATPase